MKNRITTALAITLTTLGLVGLPALASAERNRHNGDLFTPKQHSGERHHDRHRQDHRGDQHRGRGHNGGYSERYRDRDYHGQHRHDRRRHDSGHHYGHKKHHSGHHRGHHAYKHLGHGHHMGFSGVYVDPFLGIRINIH